MDTRQLLTFITLAETLNYPRAAERLQYAPSTLHRHIQLLEEELGLPLFSKAGRQLLLTEEGRRLLPEAKVAYEKCRDFLSAAHGESTHSISVGGCELNTSYALRDFLQGFAAAHPEVGYSMTTSPNSDAPDLLRSGAIDLCFYYSRTIRRPKGLSFVPLYREPICCCAPAGSPLLKKKNLRFEDLAYVPVVHSHDSCYAFIDYREQMKKRGIPTGKTLLLGGMSLVAQQAQKLNALMLMPAHGLAALQADFGVLPLSMAEPLSSFWQTIVFRNADELSYREQLLIRSAVDFARRECEAHPDLYVAPPSYEPYLAELQL
ncbi:MAG: LysR family transcriptional regulator [Clostridia bacterium]|nr:LysR family transcriptional regulator [Clostridia bacterium]